ncbi:MAG: hypothetical protein ACU0A6_04025 [Shimia sp.]|uniref:hypothetical protein n=1 Tax=Shimia sp. TaxID=1954381 RepID=UPI004059EDC2
MTSPYPPKTSSVLDPEIGALKDALRSATEDLIEMCRQLQAVGAKLPADAGMILTDVRHCLRMAIEAETDIEKRDFKQGTGRPDAAIDLQRARSSIRCRLDRLRDCRDTGGVS